MLVAIRVNATAERAFEVSTREIGRWWQPNGLFEFQHGKRRAPAFTPSRRRQFYGDYSQRRRPRHWQGARLGTPRLLVFSRRQASFEAGQETEVHVTFEPAEGQAKATVAGIGWETVPQDHVARHGFPRRSSGSGTPSGGRPVQNSHAMLRAGDAPFFEKWEIVEASVFDDPYREGLPDELNLLVVFAADAPWTLFDLVHMESELSDLTKKRAEISTRFGFLHTPNANEGVAGRVFESARLIYEKRGRAAR